MNIRRTVVLLLAILSLPAALVLATSNYNYGPDEYVTIANGISPDGKIAITTHGTGDLGDEDFHVYLTDAATGKKIGPLEEITEYLDTAGPAFLAQWSKDGQQVTIVWRVDRHEPLKAISYRIAGSRAQKIKGPFNVKDGDPLEKSFIKECAGDGKPSPKIFGKSLKHED